MPVSKGSPRPPERLEPGHDPGSQGGEVRLHPAYVARLEKCLAARRKDLDSVIQQIRRMIAGLVAQIADAGDRIDRDCQDQLLEILESAGVAIDAIESSRSLTDAGRELEAVRGRILAVAQRFERVAGHTK